MIELSVVVAARNAAETIGAQLTALTAQLDDLDCEIVIVDNGSTDTTAEIARQFCSADPERVRLVQAIDTAGCSYACNVGAKHARGRSLAFCDADDVVAHGWLAALTAGLREHEFVTGPLELDLLNDSDAIRARGRWLERHCPGVFLDAFPFASGCNIGIRRQLFRAISGYDESMETGMDVDLSLRLWRSGVELVALPNAVIHYRYRNTPLATWRQARAHARATPGLARQLHETHRVGWRRRLSGARTWLWLLSHIRSALTPRRRAGYLWGLGTACGRLEGSIRARWLFL